MKLQRPRATRFTTFNCTFYFPLLYFLLPFIVLFTSPLYVLYSIKKYKYVLYFSLKYNQCRRK